MQTKSLVVKCMEDVDDLKQYQMILEYYLVEKEIAEEYCDLKSYGVQITKISIFNDGRRSEEYKLINDIFFDKNDAENFIQIIAENRVTPTSLRDVIDDFIGQTINMRKQASDKTA
ncbi:MAG: DUF6514 family protein [Clostridia bacterium]|nr:DUF6514 family protein [Clostridia bacterium]